MTFEQFQSTREWSDDLSPILGFESCGQRYAADLTIESAIAIEGATGEYVLTIGNVQEFGDLEVLERTLFDWAAREGYFAEVAS
jgi:hypothetical protein